MPKLNRKYEINFLCEIILKIFERLEVSSIIFFGAEEDKELIENIEKIKKLNNL